MPQAGKQQAGPNTAGVSLLKNAARPGQQQQSNAIIPAVTSVEEQTSEAQAAIEQQQHTGKRHDAATITTTTRNARAGNLAHTYATQSKQQQQAMENTPTDRRNGDQQAVAGRLVQTVESKQSTTVI